MKLIREPAGVDHSRRRFIKSSSMITASSTIIGMTPVVARSTMLNSVSSISSNPIAINSLGFNGQRRDPVTNNYHLGNGYRVYNPRTIRFNAPDSMSPFGKGGINSYAYCLGDPINKSDPSGHFAFLTFLIGAIVGAVVGAGVSAASEGIYMAIDSNHKFDWKSVAIGAGVGFITGGIGTAASGASKAGTSLYTTLAKSAAIDFISVPLSAVTALSMQPGAPKWLQTTGKVVGFSLAIAGVAYGLKGATKLARNVARGRFMGSGSTARAMQRVGKTRITDDYKLYSVISRREMLFQGISIATGLASATSGVAFNTLNHLGKDSYMSNIMMRAFHFTSSASGYASGRSLNIIKAFKSDRVGFTSSRFTDLSHLTGLIGLLATEPGSQSNNILNKISFMAGVNSVYTLNLQNHLKYFDKKSEVIGRSYKSYGFDA
ncbi:RHS repeat-associated core domain-containing protein [Vibrio aestuarianus]|uniref:RHS repeat-associated core domain-containing protein n=1 Tax=Vibrio aestuarianus TaxID=28171 RepID=UPI00237CE96F|nr:RHS repeat-associated core domain-containing protein [Vibrio aestuarianus]MDE1337376.1 RHS repeat-associated core domain-containing protein [Vibrio aestuarianus]